MDKIKDYTKRYDISILATEEEYNELKGRFRFSKEVVLIDDTPSTVMFVFEVVCEQFNVTIEQMKSKSKRAEVVTARQVFLYFMRIIHKKMSQEVCASYVNRNHATVVHSVSEILRKMSPYGEAGFAKKIKDVEKELYSDRRLSYFSSKHRGIYKEDGKWLARTYANGRYHYLGYYNTEKEAKEAYDNAMNGKAHGTYKRPIRTSSYTGVYSNYSGSRWIAQLSKDSKTIYLGCFNTEKQAKKAVDNYNKNN